MKDNNKLEDWKELINSIDNNFLITLAIVFSGLWILLYNIIIEETTRRVTVGISALVWNYVIIHCIISLMIFLILFTYFAKGLFIINQKYELVLLKPIKIPGLVIDILRAAVRVSHVYWILFFLLCAYLYMCTPFINDTLAFINSII